jgi:uncharacterized protein YvpB
VAVGALVFAGAGLVQLTGNGTGGQGDPKRRDTPTRLVVEMHAGERVLQRLDASRALRDGRIDAAGLRRVLASELARRWKVTAGPARIVYVANLTRVARRVAGAGGPVVTVQATPRSSEIRAPVVAQALRNNCESAALEVLLATAGRRRPQMELQAALPRSGPLDPMDGPNGRLWGDPALGYVGRADGSGPAGGFGVYQGPVRGLAADAGVELEDLTGRRLSDVLQRVRDGRAVMVWVGLSDGPYGSWRSPEGRRIRVNFGEHTVVLTGVLADGRVSVVNVLEGTRETWSQGRLLEMWERLGRRALAAPPPA